MLTLIAIFQGVLLIVLAVYGGILASSEKRHRNAFFVCGVLGIILVIAQGILLHREDEKHSGDIVDLKKITGNLRDQVIALNNALKLQVSIDDIHHLEATITTGFSHLESLG